MTVAKTIDVRGGVLVGHDGSVDARDALTTAVQWAASLKTHVTVVRAWNIFTAPRPASWAAGYMPALEEFEAATLTILEQDASSVRAANPKVSIDCRVVHGAAADNLIKASSAVDLIVVGRRGRGGFPGLALGSVSEQVVRHARCSVLVAKTAIREGDEHVVVSSSAEATDAPATDEQQRMEQALVSELKLDLE